MTILSGPIAFNAKSLNSSDLLPSLASVLLLGGRGSAIGHFPNHAARGLGVHKTRLFSERSVMRRERFLFETPLRQLGQRRPDIVGFET